MLLLKSFCLLAMFQSPRFGVMRRKGGYFGFCRLEGLRLGRPVENSGGRRSKRLTFPPDARSTASQRLTGGRPFSSHL